jgi:5-methylcytosine-specific restriction endonuclease McrA
MATNQENSIEDITNKINNIDISNNKKITEEELDKLLNKINYKSQKKGKNYKFLLEHINKEGKSDLIKRHELKEAHWTSGDSIFNSRGILCSYFKIQRYKKNFNKTDKSINWELSEEEQKEIENDVKQMPESKYSPTTVTYIKFFGILKIKTTNNDEIREDIRGIINKQPCANCFIEENIQTDHKNSLKNDPRVTNKKTQKLDDFQPLCRSCNCKKREDEIKTKRNNKRFSGKELGYSVDFTEGDETLDINDPNWYIGTYWGDCLEFKKKLTIK